MSRPDRTFPTLNAVRGIGALMVLTTHAAFNTGQILRGWPGGVLARLDFGVPMDQMRAKLDEILEGNARWDGRVKAVQVTDASELTQICTTSSCRCPAERSE